MKSFDHILDEEVKFGDSQRVCFGKGFEAGQQSKQAEVDELRKNFNNALKTIEIQQRFLDDADGANKILTSQVSELRKRIDLALEYIEPSDNINHKAYRDLYKILKGACDD